MKHIFMATGEKYSFPAISLDVVCKPVPKSDWPVMQHRLAHLRDLPLTKSGGRIDLLVGLDLSALMVPTETRRAHRYRVPGGPAMEIRRASVPLQPGDGGKPTCEPYTSLRTRQVVREELSEGRA